MRVTAEMLAHAKGMRRAPTAAEHCIWKWLRSRRFSGWKFRRQYPIGGAILDFYCPKLKLGLELDGGQHATPWVAEADGRRALRLKRLGVEIVRVTNAVALDDPESVAIWLDAQIEARRAVLGC